MRIAAVVDIHGNLPALEVVLADIESVGVDQMVFCGDVVLGAPDDRACYYRVLETGAPVIRGNAERYLAEFGPPAADPPGRRNSSVPFSTLQANSPTASAASSAIFPLPVDSRLPRMSCSTTPILATTWTY